jgi:hypothetical protein
LEDEFEYLVKIEAYNKLYLIDFRDDLQEAIDLAETMHYSFCFDDNSVDDSFIDVIPINGNVKYVSEVNSEFILCNGIVSVTVLKVLRDPMELEIYIRERVNLSYVLTIDQISCLDESLSGEFEFHQCIAN